MAMSSNTHSTYKTVPDCRHRYLTTTLSSCRFFSIEAAPGIAIQLQHAQNIATSSQTMRSRFRKLVKAYRYVPVRFYACRYAIPPPPRQTKSTAIHPRRLEHSDKLPNDAITPLAAYVSPSLCSKQDLIISRCWPGASTRL